MDDLWTYLRLGLTGLPGRVICVADALDEMNTDHDRFLQSLAALGHWKINKVMVLITSRPMPSLEECFRRTPLHTLRLDEKMVDMAVRSYVYRSLVSSELSLEDRSLVKAAIPGHANGIFMYAKLATDTFLELGARIEEVLQQIPSGLHGMYKSLLAEHSRRSGVPQDVQLHILQWVTHATRSLRLLELAEVIRVTHQVA